MSATMITVTGLVFALTIVALQIASGRYSPRLLRNFMRDRGTQVVLGVFVGAFAYSTAGLHTVGIQRAGGEAFVPRLAVSGSLVLGLVSAGVLIYFIHDLARSSQIDAIVGQVERETRWVIDDLYPNGSGYLEPEQRCPDPPASAAVLPAGRSGYLQAVQPELLIRAATRQDLVVRLARQVGDHVVAGTPLAFAWRRDLNQPAADAQALQAALAAAVASGFERTMVQDVPFGCAVWSISATRSCRRRSTIPPPGSRRSSTCRCCCACWPAGGLATGSITTSRDAARRRPLPAVRRLPAARHRPDSPVGSQGAGGARSLIQLLQDIGVCGERGRRRACARHIWLVLEDAKREIAQPADLEPVQADGAVALAALGADRPQLTDGCTAGSFRA
jgi:uncharacterized membrane protein